MSVITAERPGQIPIVAIQGSVRPGNYTAMALALVVDELRKREKYAVDVINPGVLNLPFPGIPDETGDVIHLKRLVQGATGVILATPEYHGTFSSVMKLVIENLGFPSALAGKPVALLGVAAGTIGAIKSLEALASVCTHVGALVLPGAVSVANVQSVFDANGNIIDPASEKRIRSVATHMVDYIHGFICPRIALEEMVRTAAK